MIGLRFFVCMCGIAAAAVLISEVRPALARLDLFRVRQIRVEGVRHLDPEAVIAAAAVPAGASLWDEADPWVEALRRHPLIRDAQVRRRLPHTLVLHITERAPVALVPTPRLQPVDAEGVILPLDPARTALDLPIIRPPEARGTALGRRASAGVRTLAAEIERLKEMAPALVVTVSDLALDGGGNVSARLIDPPVELRYRPPLDARRLGHGLLVLRDAAARREDAVPATIDLRFADQVVVRYGVPSSPSPPLPNGS